MKSSLILMTAALSASGVTAHAHVGNDQDRTSGLRSARSLQLFDGDEEGTVNSIYAIARSNDEFSTLVAAIDAAGLDGVLSGGGTFTVFAPLNTAFDKLDQDGLATLLQPEWKLHLQDVLLYHVLGFAAVFSTDWTDGQTYALNGEVVTFNLDPPRINDESIIDLSLVDIVADNGVIHAIDSVLLPTSLTSNIVDIAQANPDFSILVDLVIAADLVDALTGAGPPLTLFAPTNEAFDKLPAGTVDMLKEPEHMDHLIEILVYHVVAGNVGSDDLVDGPVFTLQGSTVDIDAMEPAVNDARIVMADILANNGIIHVIDTVLIPGGSSDTTTTTTTSGDTMSKASKGYKLMPKADKAAKMENKAGKMLKSPKSGKTSSKSGKMLSSPKAAKTTPTDDDTKSSKSAKMTPTDDDMIPASPATSPAGSGPTVTESESEEASGSNGIPEAPAPTPAPTDGAPEEGEDEDTTSTTSVSEVTASTVTSEDTTTTSSSEVTASSVTSEDTTTTSSSEDEEEEGDEGEDE